MDKKKMVFAASVLALLVIVIPAVCFAAEGASVVDYSDVFSAMAGEVTNAIQMVLPIVLPVIGILLGISLAIKLTKRIVGKA